MTARSTMVSRLVAPPGMPVNATLRLDEAWCSALGEAQAAKIGFSAYAISADMNDPIVQAIHSLLDHAASTDGRLQMLIDRLQTEGVDCGDAKATAERFDPTQINKMLE